MKIREKEMQSKHSEGNNKAMSRNHWNRKKKTTEKNQGSQRLVSRKNQKWQTFYQTEQRKILKKMTEIRNERGNITTNFTYYKHILWYALGNKI